MGFFPYREAQKLAMNPLQQQPAIHGTVFHHILPFVEQANIWQNSRGMSRDTKAVVNVYVTQIDFTLPANHKIADGQGTISYAANGYVLGGGTYSKNGKGMSGDMLVEGAFFSRRTLAQITAQDGTSNTLAFAERFAQCDAKDAKGKEIDYQHAWSEDGKDHTPFSPVVWKHDLLPQFGATSRHANEKAGKGKAPCDPAAFQAFGNTINVAMFDGHVISVSSRVTRQSWSDAMRDDDGNVPGKDFAP